MTATDGTTIEGEISYTVPFGERHLNDPDYLSWLHDYEVVRMLNRPDYWEPVRFAEVAAYCRTLMSSENDHFFALYYRPENLFLGTLRAGHIDWTSRTADIGIMIGAAASPVTRSAR